MFSLEHFVEDKPLISDEFPLPHLKILSSMIYTKPSGFKDET